MNISERIKYYRKENGLTQKELGFKINKSPQVISNWERGYTTTINQDDIVVLSGVFGIPVEELIKENSSSPARPRPHMDSRTRRQLEKILEDDELTYNGVVLNAEDKERVRKALELAFWDIKEKNRHKK
ncbi:DNA-binding helix-turn-helix protein [Selenomonas noxia ATCC 43541]|uniref:helix-turn-helix domain-containing protein n=1 Tax=Selenomonas noxia TaxID=135083 RepID=UPI0001BCECF7|nr:helix-turn-helix transcriptional regulator [Selenomonas noxia]EFF65338.1 DNA-binding helix-turn-helix protein [Selenomonas noxia ATCC 43541]